MKHYRMEVGEKFFDEMANKRRESPGEVVMLIRRPEGRVLLTTKEFYPEGVYRLPSGRTRVGEQPEEALVREVREETGFKVRAERLLEVVHFMFEHESKRVDYLSYVFLTTETEGDPSPEDEDELISGFSDVDPCILCVIGRQLEDLGDGWHDWGRFRSPAHEIAYRELSPKEPHA